ncbi:MAG: PepSY domain-containing protein [Acidobacteria bacterium]|nr:PepSY domain-containing protein [Acidobacteriota bacterium]
MKAFRKLIFWLHLIVGIVTGVVVFIMSITGVALTYEKQMQRWADGYEVEPPSFGAQPLGPAALLERARLQNGKAPSGVTYESDPEAPARILYGRESVAVNPYTGATLGGGAESLDGFFGQMTAWHRWLGQQGEGRDVGKALTGASNLGFLFIVVTGMYLWIPKRWSWQHLRPIVWFRGGLSAKARDFNWHNTMGLWCAIPLFFVVATAVFFSYPWANQALYAITGEQQPAGRGGPPGRGGPGGPGGPGGREGGPGRGGPRGGGEQQEIVLEGLDAAWTSARAAVPRWKSLSFRPASKPGGEISVSADRGNGGQPQLRSTLTIDGASGEILKEETFADQSTGRRMRSYIRFLHTGEVFGWIGQTIAGVASLAACFLVYTGWMLSWRRFRAWQARRA